MTDRERLQVAIDEALSFLSEAERGATATAQLPERVVKRSDTEARKKLGDAIYDLARRCATADPEVGAEISFCGGEPADQEALRSSIGSLSNRTSQAATTQQVKTIDEAISTLEALEGASESSHFLRCLRAVSMGRWDEAVVLSEQLVESASSLKWRTHAREQLSFGLLKLKRYDAALSVADEALRANEVSQPLCFNRAAACAWLRDVERFRDSAQLFKENAPTDMDRAFWRRLVTAHAAEMNDGTGLSVDELYQAFGVY